MKQINRNLYPRDGFFYKDHDGATIRGDTWAGVIRRVENYRKRAGYPPGNPEQEVIAQACSREPVLCSEDNGVYSAEVLRASLKSRILLWFVNMQKRIAKEPAQFVSEAEANERAGICAGCPRNTPLPEGCASCRAAVEESRRGIIGGRNWDARLNACSVLAEDLNSTRWIEQQRLDDGALPANCWRRRQV